MEHSVLYEWNSVDSALHIPSVAQNKIRKIYIYDFDNTLFKSPAPNPHLYSKELYKSLLSPHVYSNGGWWSEPRFLEILVDEWINGSADDSAFWNKELVDLAKRSWADRGDDSVVILMTGRKEVLFSSLFEKILKHPVFGDKLSFHGVFLKRAGFPTTMDYKLTCLHSLLDFYQNIDQIHIYDDRKQQLEGFEAFFERYKLEKNHSFDHVLVPVTAVINYLPPLKEIATVAKIIDEHNRDVHLKLKGLETLHGPICSMGFQMNRITLNRDMVSPRYLLDCGDAYKIRSLVKQMAEDTKQSLPFSQPVIVPLGTLPGSQTERFQSYPLITPQVSADEVDKLFENPTHFCPNEAVQWSIREAILMDSRKLAFSVISQQKPGLHILFTSDYSLEDLIALMDESNNRHTRLQVNHSLPTLRAIEVPLFNFAAETITRVD